MSRLSARHGSTNTGREVAPTRDERTIDWLDKYLSAEIQRLEQTKEPCTPDCKECEEDREWYTPFWQRFWEGRAAREGKRSGEALHGEDPEASR